MCCVDALRSTNVVATAVTSTSVSVTWTGTAGATYEVLRVAAGGVSSTLGTSTSGAFTDNTATADTAYLQHDAGTAGTLIRAADINDLRNGVK